MNTSTSTYKSHRFPPEIISHAVWLYFRLSLSYRDVEELLCKRGIMGHHPLGALEHLQMAP